MQFFSFFNSLMNDLTADCDGIIFIVHKFNFFEIFLSVLRTVVVLPVTSVTSWSTVRHPLVS